MSALTQWLADGAYHAPFSYVALATVLWFTAIYALIAGGVYLFAIDKLPATVEGRGGRIQRMRAGQVREELLLSALSILIFALQAALLVWALRAGWLEIAWERSLWHLAWELPVLYLWNEIYSLFCICSHTCYVISFNITGGAMASEDSAAETLRLLLKQKLGFLATYGYGFGSI